MDHSNDAQVQVTMLHVAKQVPPCHCNERCQQEPGNQEEDLHHLRQVCSGLSRPYLKKIIGKPKYSLAYTKKNWGIRVGTFPICCVIKISIKAKFNQETLHY